MEEYTDEAAAPVICKNASFPCVQTARLQLELALRRIYCMIEFSLFRLPLDIGVYLRYIKCINNVNTLLTYLVQYMLRFPEVFEDLAALAVE